MSCVLFYLLLLILHVDFSGGREGKESLYDFNLERTEISYSNGPRFGGSIFML